MKPQKCTNCGKKVKGEVYLNMKLLCTICYLRLKAKQKEKRELERRKNNQLNKTMGG